MSGDQNDFDSYKEEDLVKLMEFANANIIGRSLHQAITAPLERVFVGGILRLFKKELSEGHDLTEILVRAIFMGILVAEIGKTNLIRKEETVQ